MNCLTFDTNNITSYYNLHPGNNQWKFSMNSFNNRKLFIPINIQNNCSKCYQYKNGHQHGNPLHKIDTYPFMSWWVNSFLWLFVTLKSYIIVECYTCSISIHIKSPLNACRIYNIYNNYKLSRNRLVNNVIRFFVKQFYPFRYANFLKM